MRQSPRPLVLVGGDVVGPKGFRSGEAQDAFGVGVVEWEVEVPAEVREIVRRAATLRLPTRPLRPIAITHTGRGEFAFVTDRGPTTLPAWWVQGPETIGPIWVLSPEITHWQPGEGAGGPPPAPPTQIPVLWSPIEISSDGLQISFSWLQENPAGQSVEDVEGIESDTAVSLAVIVKPHPPEGGVRAHTLQGRFHRVTAWLQEPLGARVFVGLHGEPLEVIPMGSSSTEPWPAPRSIRDFPSSN